MQPTTSPARLEANRANAQKSTGPRTNEGKARAAANARKHGLNARDLVIAPSEAAEFEEMQLHFAGTLNPVGILEQTVFQQVIAAAWNLRRVRRMEVESLASGADALDTLDRLARHLTRFERSYNRAVSELRTLQTERTHRALHSNAPDESLDLPWLVSLVRLEKYTGVRTRYAHSGAAPATNIGAPGAIVGAARPSSPVFSSENSTGGLAS